MQKILRLVKARKIMVALVIAITATDRFCERLYGPHKKRAKDCCRPYASLFSDLNTKFLKLRINRSRKTSVFMWKSAVYFNAPLPLSDSAP